MAIQRFKIALNAARFPLVSTKGQRAVFVLENEYSLNLTQAESLKLMES